MAVFHFHASFCILVGITHLTICEIGLTAVYRQPVNPSLAMQFEMLVQMLEMFQGMQVYWPQFRNQFQVAFLKEDSMSSAGESRMYLIKGLKLFGFMTSIFKEGAFKAYTHLFKLFPYDNSLSLCKVERAPSPPRIRDAQDISGSLQNYLSTEQLIELRPNFKNR